MDALHESYLEQILEQRRRRGVLRATPPSQAQQDYEIHSRSQRYIRPPTPPPAPITNTTVNARVPASTQTSQAVVTYASHDDNTRCTPSTLKTLVQKNEEDDNARQECVQTGRSNASAMRSRYELHRRAIASPPQIPDEEYDEGNNNKEEEDEEEEYVHKRDRPRPLYYRRVYRPTPRITLSQRIEQQQQQQRQNNYRYNAGQPYLRSHLSQRPASVLASSRLTSTTPLSHTYTSSSSSSSSPSSSTYSERTRSTWATRTSTYPNHRSTQDNHANLLQARPVYTLRTAVPAPSHAADYSQGMSNNNNNNIIYDDDEEDVHDVRQAHIAAPLRSSSTTSRVSQPDAFSDKSNPPPPPSTHRSTPHPAPAVNTPSVQQQPPQQQLTTTPLQRQETSKPAQVQPSTPPPQPQVLPQVQTQGSPREAEHTATPPPSATSSPLSAHNHTPPPPPPSQQQHTTLEHEEKDKNIRSKTPSTQSPLSALHTTPNTKTTHGPALTFHYTDTHNVTHSPSNRGTHTSPGPPPPSSLTTTSQRNWRTHSAGYCDDFHDSPLPSSYDNTWREAERGRHARSASYSAATRRRNVPHSYMHSPIHPTNHSYSLYNDRSLSATRAQERAGRSLRLSGVSDTSMERKSNKQQHASSSPPSRTSEHNKTAHKQHHHHHHRNNKKRGDAEDTAKSTSKKDHTHHHYHNTFGPEEQPSHRPAAHRSPAHARVSSMAMEEHTTPSSATAHPHIHNTKTNRIVSSMPTVYRLPSHALQAQPQQQQQQIDGSSEYVRANPSQHYSLLQPAVPSSAFSVLSLSPPTHSRRAPRPLPEVRSTLDLRTSVRILQAGQWFYKWCRGDSVVKQRWVWLETRSHLLVWSHKQTIHSSFSGSIPLESLWQITPRELLQPDRNGVTRIYYVLQIYTTKRTLQLATERKDKADTWFEALYNVMGFIRRHDLTRGALTPD